MTDISTGQVAGRASVGAGRPGRVRLGRVRLGRVRLGRVRLGRAWPQRGGRRGAGRPSIWAAVHACAVLAGPAASADAATAAEDDGLRLAGDARLGRP